MAENVNATSSILGAVIDVNDSARKHFVTKVIRMLGGDGKGKTIGVLGLSLEPDTDDMRESPAVEIIAGLQAAGGRI